MPIDMENPTTTRFSYERYVVSTFKDKLSGFFGKYDVSYFPHLPQGRQVIEPYIWKAEKAKVLSSIEINASNVLNVNR